MAPAGDSVLTPLGDKGCAAAVAVMTARTPIAVSLSLNTFHSFFDSIDRISALDLRFSLMLTSLSFVPLAAP
jgi:hypothetical protein